MHFILAGARVEKGKDKITPGEKVFFLEEMEIQATTKS